MTRTGRDFHGVAALQLTGERRDSAVYQRARAVISDLGVHGEGEIDGRRTLGQLLHIARRRENEDLVLIQIDAQELEKLLGLLRLLLPFQDLSKPRQLLIDFVGRALVALLVAPVRRDSELRRPVHFVRPDLNLVKTPTGSEDRRVQRAVHVRLGRGDVIVEALGQRRPLVVDHSQSMVAVFDALHLYPDRHQVVDVFVRLTPLHDLVVNRPEVLRPALHLAGDARPLQLLAQWLAELANPLLALHASLAQLLGELPVGLGLQHLEGEVFQLPADLGHPQAVSERGVNIPRLEGDALLLA